MAEEMTTVSALPRWAASWPMWTCAPSLARAARTRDFLASDPLTAIPWANITRATPDIPAPPMAMKWTEPRLLAAGTSAVKSKRLFEGVEVIGHLASSQQRQPDQPIARRTDALRC